MTDFIEARGLSYYYDDGDTTPALRSVDLTVKKGEYVAILGHNGSGKSTLAKLLNLILLPTAGSLSVAGIRVSPEMSEDDLFRIREKVGMVFQNPDNQLVATVVEEDVAFGPENLGLPPEEIRARVEEALETVGMTAYKKHAPSYLSGGQKQRVALAGVMAMRPSCIIFDESTAMLDPQGRRDVVNCMERLHRDFGITVLHITHYMEEAARADRVIVMNDGVILLDDTPKAVFRCREKLNEIGLGIPQGAELLARLREAGIAVPDDCLSPEECAEAILSLLKGKGAAPWIN